MPLRRHLRLICWFFLSGYFEFGTRTGTGLSFGSCRRSFIIFRILLIIVVAIITTKTLATKFARKVIIILQPSNHTKRKDYRYFLPL
jgi:hypothetical protein